VERLSAGEQHAAGKRERPVDDSRLGQRPREHPQVIVGLLELALYLGVQFVDRTLPPIACQPALAIVVLTRRTAVLVRLPDLQRADGEHRTDLVQPVGHALPDPVIGDRFLLRHRGVKSVPSSKVSR
jgi:hypothetical protein